MIRNAHLTGNRAALGSALFVGYVPSTLWSIVTIVGIVLLVVGCSGEKPASVVQEGLPTELRDNLGVALESYERIRISLAQDRFEGIPEAASLLASELVDGGTPLQDDRLSQARNAAEAMAKAPTIDEARRRFAELSQPLISLVAQSTELSGARFLFLCPMVDGFNQWIQNTDGIENPYMGGRMPSCGTALPWPRTAVVQDTAAHTQHGEIAYYTCPMHPSVRSSTPGQCPICGMDLVPVTQEELRTGTITVDAQRRQTIGLKTGPVVRKPVTKTIRAVGRIVYDETGLADVTLKVGGWIEALHADATGMRVRMGDPLFTLYSPELYVAQEEFLTALRSQGMAGSTSVPDRADYLVDAARRRLELLDLTAAQIDGVAENGRPIRSFPILSPVSGYVIEKNVVKGTSVEPKAVLFRIADLDRIWIEAEFYTSELEMVSVGAPVRVTLPYFVDRSIAGTVTYVYPYLDGASRTGRVRIVLENRDLDLKPEMYATVELAVEAGERLTVPETAVLPTGERDFVFLDLGGGRIRPQRVELGIRAGDDVEVLSGLREGDVIVVSGNFLIAAESRLKTAMERW
jgi:Cu(I)/Ag(I) efflux system membrane fusion protein